MTLTIQLLREDQIIEAEQIFRLAFGTFIGLPNPTDFCGDASYFYRWKTDPSAVFAAELDGKLVGTNLVTQWGSFGFFGPLTVHPDFWNQGIAQPLIAAAMDYFKTRHIYQTGLFTFSASPKHHALYQKFGFWQQYLTCVMAKPIASAAHPLKSAEYSYYSQLNEDEQSRILKTCFEITDSIFAGLDVTIEIKVVQEQNLGETVLLWDDSALVGFAICHFGAGSEAGSNVCYAKFAAVRPGAKAGQHFDQLLDLVEILGATLEASSLTAGVNTSRNDAYRRMIARGYRTEITGVAMLNPNEPAFNRPDVYVIDDWR
jgi:GNAT superfamily N-acetyltransferase